MSEQIGRSSQGNLVSKYLRYATMLEDYVRTQDNSFRWLYHTASSYQAAAYYSKGRPEQQEYLEKAHEYYNLVLHSPESLLEYSYGAQYRLGEVLESLNYPWALVEKAMLKANEIDPVRGEPYRYIILHYLRNKDGELAYKYTSMGVKSFFGKNPYPERIMMVQETFYNWEILEYHIAACQFSQRWNMAKDTFQILKALLTTNPSWFTDSDTHRILFEIPLYLDRPQIKKTKWPTFSIPSILKRT